MPCPKPPEPLTDIPESTDIAADLLKLMASPDLASRRWIWEQYDQSGRRRHRPAPRRRRGGGARPRLEKALAITTDCTPRYCYADPVEGGKQAVAEAYRNLCAVGAKPLAITNCLNFGNPQRPEIMGQFVGCVEGMAEACRALDFPIVSGNVSLYNETKNEDGTSLAILPTPAIGGVGSARGLGEVDDDRVQGGRPCSTCSAVRPHFYDWVRECTATSQPRSGYPERPSWPVDLAAILPRAS